MLFQPVVEKLGGPTFPGKIAFDSEVATLTGKTGIAFATVDDRRVLTDTPLDTIDRMDLKKDENLHAQNKILGIYFWSKLCGTLRCQLQLVLIIFIVV